MEGGEHFYPQSLEKGQRSERALRLAVAEMYVQGVSTRRVVEITRELCGLDVSSTDVSRAAALLDQELEQWRTRPLGRFEYLVLDARYEKVRHGGCVRDCALLTAIGIDEAGKRSVLGTSVSLSEAEVHWREFLASLQERGLHGVELVVSDDHKGLRAALTARFAGVTWQRCQFHLQQNAQAYVPRKALRRQVVQYARRVQGTQPVSLAAAILTYTEREGPLATPVWDPWGAPYELVRSRDQYFVHSPGPDRLGGSPDDVFWPVLFWPVPGGS